MKEVDFHDTGTHYDGEWLQGFRHGKGKMTFSDRATYDGEWFLGYAQGYGTFNFCKDGKISETYTGYFYDSMRHGTGTLQHMNGD